MLSVFTGGDTVLLERALKRRIANFKGETERVDGGEVDFDILSDLVRGLSLFQDERLVVIRHLASNKPIWQALPEWVDEMVDSQTRLILVEPTLDRRTRTYRVLTERAEVKVFERLDERNLPAAYRYAANEAARQQLNLTDQQVRSVVARTGPDSVRIVQAIDKLSLFGDVSDAVIEQLVDKSPQDNIFQLLEAALSGNQAKTQSLINDLKLQQDPYKTFGLLAYQAEVLAALVLGKGQPYTQIASDLGVNSYSARQLSGRANKLKKPEAENLIKQFKVTDEQIKSSSVEAWTMIEKLLMSLALS